VIALAQEEREVFYDALPHQLKALQSQKPITAAICGVGAGKTDVGSIWSLDRASASPAGVLGLIAANTYPQLFDSTLRNTFKNWDRLGVSYLPRELPSSHKPFSLRVRAEGGWREILCRSLDHYETLAGVELGWGWMDEVYQTERGAYDLILARLRDARMPAALRQLLLTSTADDPSSWMYEELVQNFDERLMEVIYAKTTDNPFLPDGYIDILRSRYDARMAARMIEAQWVALSGQVVYHAFSRERNVSSEVRFDPNLPICWSHDFNIGVGKPMSSILGQMRKGPHGVEFHVFDELVLDSSDTNDAIEEFFARPWRSLAGVRIYGDPAGNARDTRSKKTDYALLAEAGFTDQRVANKHPAIRDRHNAVNSLLRNAAGHVRIKIHPDCRTLIKGLETVLLREGAQYLEKETREQHVTTPLGYWACYESPVSGQKPVSLPQSQTVWAR